jgi:TolA-binding protein
MKRICTVFLLLLTHFYFNVSAQHPATFPQGTTHYEKGLELYGYNQWAGARASLQKFVADPAVSKNDLRRAEAAYYIAMSALRLGNDDAEVLAENFVQQYEQHPKASLAYYELGTYYYQKNNLSKALNYLELTDRSKLNPTQQEELDFTIAYIYFGKKEFDNALSRFNTLKRTDNRYSYAASYYAGYIYYTKDQYDQAAYDLERAEKNEAYASVVPPLMANIYYRQRMYDKLISYVESKQNSQTAGGELDLLAAEAYFQKKQYAEAATRFERYTRKNRADDQVRYRMAFSEYKTGKNQEAIENFKPLADKSDSLAQYAAYYLGNLYVSADNKAFAQSAYSKASELSFNKNIQEESLFQVAKLQYDQKQYELAGNNLKEFKQNYPRSKYTAEVNDLLSNSLLKTRNYDQAIAYLESISLNTPRLERAYQEVTYLRGTEQFNDGKFYNAVTLWQKSLQHPMDRELVAKANYWSGEAYSIGKKWPEAINSYAGVFRAATPDSEFHLKSRYGIGYAYYNSQQYDRALTHFKEYVSKSGNTDPFYTDALLRLADSYYANKVYGEAITNYKKAVDAGVKETDYALLQLGLVNGLLDNYPAANTYWNQLLTKYPQSQYRDDAQYNMAQAEFEQGSYQKAIPLFDAVIAKFSDSPFVPFAYRSKALAQYNLQQYEAARQTYVKGLERYAGHSSGYSMLLGLQEVLNQLNRSEEFDRYLSLYKRDNPTSESLEGVEYDAAKNLYFAQKYSQAINKLNSFIQTYPQSSRLEDAKFYLAEALYRNGQAQEALLQYASLAKSQTPSIRNRSLLRLANISDEQKDFVTASKYYRQLSRFSQNKREQTDAYRGLMEAYFQRQMGDSSVYFADRLIETEGAGSLSAGRANLIKGRVALKQNRLDEAQQAFQKVVSAAKDESGAEAYYQLAYIKFLNKNYEESIDSLYGFNSSYGSYTYWLGKAFLLIAENNVKLGEMFQAKETLKSIIANSTDKAITEEAKKRLAQLEAQTAADLQNQTETASDSLGN